ncbi:hypothetical protein NPIL_394491 [Nephila pilipes]|uniref:Uncharacterized protein n=1 Tax=Nephila pilipes TaxID=299642 RepID=A0A8X6Q1B3_NEPPI|nr:hypothetical protein NPIL_394491 [Nephila pilipes]
MRRYEETTLYQLESEEYHQKISSLSCFALRNLPKPSRDPYQLSGDVCQRPSELKSIKPILEDRNHYPGKPFVLLGIWDSMNLKILEDLTQMFIACLRP